MAHTADIEEYSGNIWDGGVSPMKASFGKLMMWFFLLSDAFTFSGLLVAYGTARFKENIFTGNVSDFIPSVEYWPIPDQIFDAFPFIHGVHAPLAFVGLMTFILIMSSVTMVLAVEAGHRMDKVAVEKWMLWTILGGFCFLGCQAWEWSHFIHGSGKAGWGLGIGPFGEDYTGASLYANEYGPQNFGQYFFFITGFHGTHVFSGVILNILVFYWVAVGKYEKAGNYEMVEKVGLYWHFVDLVWVFVFTFFYLL